MRAERAELRAELRGLSYTLMVSVIVVLAHVILASTVGSLRFAERIHWTWRVLLQPKHLRTSLVVAGMLFLFSGLSFWLSLGPNAEPSFVLNVGLSQGLSLGLSYWILLGFYQGMKQEHLEDQDRQQFNQGIRRSLRNGLLIGLISALIISAIGVLSYVLGVVLDYVQVFGLARPSDALQSLVPLNHELQVGTNGPSQDFGLNHELRVGLILLFPGILIMWALSGGLTVLRHYLIRWFLARSHRFPWRAQAFLDEAVERNLLQRVGGGYRFMHRRLLDYFAALDDPSSPASPNHTAHPVQQPPPMASHR